MTARSTSRALLPLASGRAVRYAVTLLRAEGRSVEPMLRRAGLTPAVIDDPDARIPEAAVNAFCREAVRVTGDDAFALHVAERIPVSAFDALGYVFRSSPNLGEALRRVGRYHRFVHEAHSLTVDVEGRRASVELRSPHDLRADRGLAEFILAALMRAARGETGVDLAPLAVDFTFPKPADWAEHRRFFRAPIHFGAARNRLLLSALDLQRRFLHADPGLSAVLEQRVREVIARLPPLETVSGRARAILAQELEGGRPTATTIGRRLGLSARTLHRHLRAEGTSLRALTLQLRRELSERYLREGATIGEVAFLLGYSEASAFHRSFKRWTGRTPAKHRQVERRT